MRTAIPFVAQLSEAEEKAWLQVLRTALSEHDIVRLDALTAAQREAAKVAIVANPAPTQLAAFPNLLWVQSLWAGVERLLVKTQEADFAIVRMTDPQLANTMAEAVLAWTLYLHRDMPRYRAQQLTQQWQQHPLPLPSERNIGLLGLGHLGKSAAQTLVHHGFTVYGWSRSQTAVDGVETLCGDRGLADVLRQSHILICLLPSTRKTCGLLNHQTLALLPPDAALINFARGSILDTDALLDHLNNGHLSHAVLDVFDEEPLPPQSPLWSHANITVLPHIAAPTHKQTASLIVANNIRQFLTQGKIPASVDRTLGY
ncbi:MAG: glyoxylate/hydroxypyruvate reductase A [Cyanobacteria bacterium P01_A01_bin.114]